MPPKVSFQPETTPELSDVETGDKKVFGMPKPIYYDTQVNPSATNEDVLGYKFYGQQSTDTRDFFECRMQDAASYCNLQFMRLAEKFNSEIPNFQSQVESIWHNCAHTAEKATNDKYIHDYGHRHAILRCSRTSVDCLSVNSANPSMSPQDQSRTEAQVMLDEIDQAAMNLIVSERGLYAEEEDELEDLYIMTELGLNFLGNTICVEAEQEEVASGTGSSD